MNDYLVWYLLEGDHEDRIRGVARNYLLAETMAEKLFYQLKFFDKKEVIQTGVKRATHGILYDDKECSLRWSVVPPEEK